MATDLTASLAAHEYLRSWLRLEFPDIEDEALRDTVEGISDLPQVVAAVVRSHLDDLALASGLQSRLANMQERLTRIEGRAEKKRALVTSVMGRADLRKLTEPDFTVSLRPTPQPLLVTAESEIPATFWKPQAPKLDRGALIAALKSGERIPGASLGNGGVTIAVRTR
jgi:hypothetical protein